MGRAAVVVVDPYSSGRELIEELLASKVFIIAVQSSQLLAASWLNQLELEKYDACISHQNIERTVDFIKSLGVEVRAIYPGSEPGVLLAEELQCKFPGVPANVEDHTGMRRHKHVMHDRLRQVGLRGIEEICTGDVEEALAWIRDTNLQFPVIVKPPLSGGSDGLHFCATTKDVRTAYAAECQKLNVNGAVNTQLLVQEFIDGPEYVVDCISNEGRHLVVGIWKYKKVKNPITRAITYEYTDFLESQGPEQDQLLPYIFQVLDALGVRFGSSHSEIIIDAKGPCLVETGARMHGGLGPKAIDLATGFPPYVLLVDIALYGARLFNELYKQHYYIMKSNVLSVDLANFKYEGRLANSIEDTLGKFCSVKVMEVMDAGDHLKLTRDLATSPGGVLMAHPDKDVVMFEYDIIRQLEDTTLYETM